MLFQAFVNYKTYRRKKSIINKHGSKRQRKAVGSYDIVILMIMKNDLRASRTILRGAYLLSGSDGQTGR